MNHLNVFFRNEHKRSRFFQVEDILRYRYLTGEERSPQTERVNPEVPKMNLSIGRDQNEERNAFIGCFFLAFL